MAQSEWTVAYRDLDVDGEAGGDLRVDVVLRLLQLLDGQRLAW